MPPQAPGFVLALRLVTDLWAAAVFASVIVTPADSVVGCMILLCKRASVQIGNKGYSVAVVHFNLH